MTRDDEIKVQNGRNFSNWFCKNVRSARLEEREKKRQERERATEGL